MGQHAVYIFPDEEFISAPGKRIQIKEIPQPPSPKMKLCFFTAQYNGHTTDEAEACDNFSVGCPNCPFKNS
jgi:hypothetical protein